MNKNREIGTVNVNTMKRHKNKHQRHLDKTGLLIRITRITCHADDEKSSACMQ